MTESTADQSFWNRQNSVSPQFDHPDMQSTPSRPSHPRFEIFIASSAGKPLFHFAYDNTHPQHPEFDPSALHRPPASVASLSAALAGFQATTFNRVSITRTATTSLLTHIHDPFHLALLAYQKPAPLPFLQALLRVVVASVQSTMSASLSEHLREKPNSRPSLAPAEPLLNAILLDAVSHPLPYALLKPVVLSSCSPPTTRHQLAQLVSKVLRKHHDVTHAIMFTAGPPFPTRLVATCGPSSSELSPLDMLLIAIIPQLDDDGRSFYPQTHSFRSGTKVFSRLVHLRLHPDHHDAFKSAVGGQTWRPEWTHHPPHTVRLAVLGSSDPTRFFDEVETALDRAPITTHLLVSIERPLRVEPFGVRGARAVLALHDEQRLAGTIAAFSYEIGIATLLTLRRVRMAACSKERQEGERAVIASFSQWDLRVVIWNLRFVVLYDHEVGNDYAIRTTREVFAPRLERCSTMIVPSGEKVLVQPRTPLAGFLAPFVS